ncbi:MAG TPA: hypothetical protein VHX38_21730 [Pseudonocardiaceae bacterium]|jgi:hypothetical protein|nr:hypothetical protein [Pseudonocardiaceae bacterium]
MTTWDELKVILARLRAQDPNPLMLYPGPEIDHDRHPPFGLRLAAWAEDIARDLHERFGADVRLRVGALDYPERSRAEPRYVQPTEDLSEQEFRVELEGPLTVRSGHTAQLQLLITNLTGTEYTMSSNGELTARVLDPATGRVVGGYTGMHRLNLVTTRLAAGETRAIRLVTGTDSYLPELGYAVPPGQWTVDTVLPVSDGREGRALRTPALPITVID